MEQRGERRTHPRAPLEIEIDLESDHNFYSGLTGDISEGGIFIGTYAPPPLGERLHLDLRLPGSEKTFRLSGAVRWVRELRAPNSDAPPGFGLEWKNLSVETQTAIRHFVAERDPSSSKRCCALSIESDGNSVSAERGPPPSKPMVR